MLANIPVVRTYFAKLGLEQEIADLYLALYANGPQTISALSRTSRIERTRIYRLIDKLLDSNLIELEMHKKRGLIKAGPITNLRLLINRREEELKNLTDELELIEQALSPNSLSHGSTHLRFFSGPEGIRQMLNRELQAQKEVVSYHGLDLESIVGQKYWDEYHASLKKRRIITRSVAPPEGTTHACHVYEDTIAYFFASDEIYGLELRDRSLSASLRCLLSDLHITPKSDVA